MSLIILVQKIASGRFSHNGSQIVLKIWSFRKAGSFKSCTDILYIIYLRVTSSNLREINLFSFALKQLP